MAGTHSMRAGMTGGTLTVIVSNITGHDLLKTIVLAGVGAVVSYLVSHLLKRFFGKGGPPPG